MLEDMNDGKKCKGRIGTGYCLVHPTFRLGEVKEVCRKDEMSHIIVDFPRDEKGLTRLTL